MGLFRIARGIIAIALIILIGAIAWLWVHTLSRPLVPTHSFEPTNTPQLVGTTTIPALSALGFVSVYVNAQGSEFVLAESNKNIALPIASITKLMTTLVASSRLAPDAPVSLTKAVLATKGAAGIYQGGEELPLSEALAAMLIASHNEIAAAIAEAAGPDFVPAMNAKVAALGLANTTFYNPVGIDPDSDPNAINRSSPYDVYRLLRAVATEQPSALALTLEPTHELKDMAGDTIAIITTTDKFLAPTPTRLVWGLATTTLPYAVRGGKTGETPRAKKNLALMTDGPCGGAIYSVVLGSADNFTDMLALLDYDTAAYEYLCQ